MQAQDMEPTPGFWHRPLKGTAILKAGSIVLAALAVVLCVLGAFIFFSMQPPKENKVIENFEVHRAAYERLRDMILADQQVKAIYAGFGVETTGSGLPHRPSEVNFSAGRYDEYTALLKQVGKGVVFRTEEKQSKLFCVIAWGAGWAGDTRHMWLCWTDREPANQVASLDAYYRDPKRPPDVFRHIDGDWYLSADW
jgi:hypothetical protein